MIKNSSDCAIVCCPLTHYCAAVSRSGPTNHNTQTFVSKQWWLGLHPLNALDIFLPCPNQCNAVVGTFQCCQDLISFSSAKSDIGVENWRNSNSWTFLSLRFTILNVTNSSLNVCIHSTHHRTMPQVEIFIVRNWKYIFRRVREREREVRLGSWGLRTRLATCARAEAFPCADSRTSSPPQLRRPVSTLAIAAAATDLSETEHRTAAGCGPEAPSETRDTWPWPPWRGWPAACCSPSRWPASAWTWTGPRSTRATAAASSASPWRRTATSRPDGESTSQ